MTQETLAKDTQEAQKSNADKMSLLLMRLLLIVLSGVAIVLATLGLITENPPLLGYIVILPLIVMLVVFVITQVFLLKEIK